MLAPEAVITTVTALAAVIAQGRTSDELSLLGAVFNQLGDTLSTLSITKDIIQNKKDDKTNDIESTADTTKNTVKKEGENSAG